MSNNSIFCINPYRYHGTWVFDDFEKLLDKEPFVAGIPEMIDELLGTTTGKTKKFTLLFSAKAFPGHQRVLQWKRKEHEGNWYYDPETEMEGWLCPALFKYFKKAPKRIYIQVKPYKGE